MTPDATAIERQKNELARILNVDGIKTGNPKWLALMREGVVVKLHVRRWLREPPHSQAATPQATQLGFATVDPFC